LSYTLKLLTGEGLHIAFTGFLPMPPGKKNGNTKVKEDIFLSMMAFVMLWWLTRRLSGRDAIGADPCIQGHVFSEPSGQ